MQILYDYHRQLAFSDSQTYLPIGFDLRQGVDIWAVFDGVIQITSGDNASRAKSPTKYYSSNVKYDR